MFLIFYRLNLWLNFLGHIVQTDVVTIILFKFGKTKTWKNRDNAKNNKSFVQAKNHFLRGRMKSIGNKKCRDQRGRCHAKTQRHLLDRAHDGARHAGCHCRSHPRRPKCSYWCIAKMRKTQSYRLVGRWPKSQFHDQQWQTTWWSIPWKSYFPTRVFDIQKKTITAE